MVFSASLPVLTMYINLSSPLRNLSHHFLINNLIIHGSSLTIKRTPEARRNTQLCTYNILPLTKLAVGSSPATFGVPPSELTSLRRFFDGYEAAGGVSEAVVDDDFRFAPHAAV